ncbi:MAG TPA: lysozyme inhibitor LprI family protein [Rhizomicrobium sp.]|nr:lysozyme inhibitor LprI family protein [Rhizomicrobium sp.]
MRIWAAVLLFLLLVPVVEFSAAAAPASPKRPYVTEDCDSAQDVPATNACFRRNYMAADAALKILYAKLLAMQSDKNSRDHLADAQTKWESFRMAECAFEIGDQDASSGSMWHTLFDGCLQDQTDTRIRQVQHLIACPVAGAEC